MGLFDFFKKKATEEQPQTEEQQEGVLELDGVEVETDAQEADIVLDVEDGQDMNRAVHAVMDEEEIQIDRAGEDILYREDAEEAPAEAEIEITFEDADGEEILTAEDAAEAEAVLDELTEIAGEILAEKPLAEDEVIVATEGGEIFTADNDADGKAFVEELADEVAEELNQEKPTEEAQETPAEESAEEEKPAKMGFFAKLKAGLDKTRKNILGGVDGVLGAFTKIDEDLFEELEEALIMAEQSDVVVMCLGLDATIEGEEGDAGNEYASGDKLGLMLPGLQEELLEAVAAVGKPVILVLSAGSAIDLSWAEEHVDAIIDSWYPGARGGKAVAEAIFGEYSPSGKLPVTFYQGTENLPEFTDYSMAHRTYRYTNENVLYPFGYGLHYGETNYDGLSVDKAESDVNEPVEVFVNVTNDSRYTVNEIVQLYIRHVDAAEYEPGYQLKGIEVVKLEPHETKKVKLTLSPRDFAVIEEDGSCVAVPGIYEISAGGQQPDDRSTKLTGKRTERIEITRCGEKTGVDY